MHYLEVDMYHLEGDMYFLEGDMHYLEGAEKGATLKSVHSVGTECSRYAKVSIFCTQN